GGRGGGGAATDGSAHQPPARGERITTVAAEAALRDARANAGLAALVLVEVHQAQPPAYGVGVEALGNDGVGRQVVLDVQLEDLVEHRIRRQRILVLLAGRQLR